MANDFTVKGTYQSPAGGNPRSSSASGDDAGKAETLATLKFATQCGVVQFVTESTPLAAGSYPFNAGTSYQDATFVFRNGRKAKKYQVKDMSLSYKASVPGGTNNVDTSAGAISALTAAWIAATSEHTGYTLKKAFYGRT